MTPDLPTVTRRLFLTATASLLTTKPGWSQAAIGPVLEWKLNDAGDRATEAIHGGNDPIACRSPEDLWVGRGIDRALRLDGYSVWIAHSDRPLPAQGDITISVWLALESYPLNEAAIFEAGTPLPTAQASSGVRFSVDKWGYLYFRRPGFTAHTWIANQPLPRAQWIHLAVTSSAAGESVLYFDGVPVPSTAAPSAAAPTGALRVPTDTIGKSNESPVEMGIFATGVLNGLMKDLRIYDVRLPQAALDEIRQETRPSLPADLQINKEWFPNDPQRPVYHAIPPRAWTNEPHGLIYWRDQYHLFYQKNANGPYWGHLNWGHMTSSDLLQWTELPVAISPENGLDSEGCWSGSVIEHDGKLALIYTAVDGHKACICAALSSDGIHFTKYAGNPLLAGTPQGLNLQDFRDPHIWREGDRYYMIVGSGVDDVGGTALLYRSDDFFHWRYLKPLMTGSKQNSGTFWEMPIFVKIGEYHVLIVCEVPGRSSYWVGTWKDESFQPLSLEPRRLELFNHYLSPTPCKTSDGSLVTLAVVPEMRGPKEQWQAGWSNLFSLPRVLSLEEPGRLSQNPISALQQLVTPVYSAGPSGLGERTPALFPGAGGSALAVHATFQRKQSSSVSVVVRRSPDGREQTVLSYNWETETLTLDRSRSSLTKPQRHAIQTVVYATLKPGRLDLRIFLDSSVLEVFVDGRDAFTSRIYPELPASQGIALVCTGGTALLESIGIGKIRRPGSGG